MRIAAAALAPAEALRAIADCHIEFRGADVFRATLVAVCVLAAGPRSRAADCNANGVDDAVDIRDATSIDCDANGVPDECDVADERLQLGRCEILSDHSGPFVLADLDGDSRPDLVRFGPGSLRVFWNEGRGDIAFSSQLVILLQRAGGRLKTLDADGDGNADLTMFGERDLQQTLSIYRSARGRRELTADHRSVPFDFAPEDWILEDLNADGVSDLVVVNGFRAQIHRGDADGSFSEAIPLSSVDPLFIVSPDVNGDGRPDLVTGNRSMNISVAINRGAGVFGASRNYFSGGAARSLDSVDIDLDGDPDLVLVNDPGRVSVLKNPGTGVFLSIESYAVGSQDDAIAIGDLDGDSFADFLVYSPDLASRSFGTLLNRGDGSFRPMGRHPTHRTDFFSAAAGDMDGDGRTEIVVSARDLSLAVFRPAMVRADCNEDGIPDGCQLEENDRNDDSIPDECEQFSCWDRPFIRSDSNADGLLDESDAVFTLVFLFVGGFPPPCGSAADVDDSGTLDIGDAVLMLSWLFVGGAPPVEPFGECDDDPNPGEWPCLSYPPCEG